MDEVLTLVQLCSSDAKNDICISPNHNKHDLKLDSASVFGTCSLLEGGRCPWCWRHRLSSPHCTSLSVVLKRPWPASHLFPAWECARVVCSCTWINSFLECSLFICVRRFVYARLPRSPPTPPAPRAPLRFASTEGEAVCKAAARSVPTTKHTHTHTQHNTENKHRVPTATHTHTHTTHTHTALLDVPQIVNACKRSSVEVWHTLFLGIHCCQRGAFNSDLFFCSSWASCGRLQYHCAVKHLNNEHL